MGQWHTLIKPAAVAALGLSAVWIGIFGLARDPQDALMKFVLSYPVFFIILCMSIMPGVYLVKRFKLNAWWVLPSTAILIHLLIGAAKSWPPGPPAIFGAMPVSAGYIFGFPIGWWKAYLFNLWPYVLFSSIGAFLFLIVHRSMRFKTF